MSPTTHPAEEAREVFIVSGSKKPQDREEVSGKQQFELPKDFYCSFFTHSIFRKECKHMNSCSS